MDTENENKQASGSELEDMFKSGGVVAGKEGEIGRAHV